MPSRSVERERLSGVGLVLLALLGWSSIPLFLRYFIHDMDAWTSNGWRYGMAALFWLPMLLRGGRSAGQDRRGLYVNAIWPAVFNAVGQVAFAWVLYLKVDPGMMSFLLRTQIVFVTAGAFLLFPDERALLLRPGFWIGLGLVAFGTLGTIFLGDKTPSGTSVWGILAGLASGALFGFYGLAVRAKMNRYSAMSSFAVISLYSAIVLVGLMLWFGERHGGGVVKLGAFQWFMLVASMMVGIALGHVFYYAAIARLGVAAATGVLLMQPFITATASHWLFGEHLTAPQWISGALSVVGAAGIIWTQRKLPAKEPARSVPPVVAAPVLAEEAV